MRQSTAVKVLAEGNSVFLTGAPGAGKTHVLNRFINYLRSKNVPAAVTAPTGIAATHIGGLTLHSWSGLGVREHVDQNVIEHLLKKSYLLKRFEKTEVLIIDEVSMLTPQLFEAVDELMRNVRFSNEPFGGMQVVLTGDFFQLPPISKNGVRRFVWQTDAWGRLNPKVCYISERHRHNDDDLIRLLDEMRSNDISELSYEVLQNCMNCQLPKDIVPTRLYTHNLDVDRINEAELHKLPGRIHRFGVVTKGRKPLCERMLQGSLIAQPLELKKGAAVMFIKNNFEQGYVNGSLGTVIDFDEESGYPLVKLSNGDIILAEPAEWSTEDESGKKLASIAQVPVRLAWAITVHKSQGMTLDAAEVDLSKAFEPGHGYVALSRVKDLRGLRLLGFNQMALSVDAAVLENDHALQRLSHETELEYANAAVNEKYKVAIPKKAEKPKTARLTHELLAEGKSVRQVAKERGLKPGTIISHIHQLIEDDMCDFSLENLLDDKAVVKKVHKAAESVKKRCNKDDLREDGVVRLTPVFEELGKKISYDDIKLALMMIQRN
jgi:hypothetical protein